MGPAGEVAHLAALPVPPALGRRRSVVGRLSGSQLLDWNRRHHEAHACRLQLVSRAWDDPRAGCGKLQVSGRHARRIAGKPPVVAQHLLDPAGRPLVRIDGEGHSVRRADGLSALGNDCNGRRPQADAEDLWYGWTQSGSEGISSFLVGAVAGQLAIHRFRFETRFCFRLALVNSGRNDFLESWPWSTADDGPRP